MINDQTFMQMAIDRARAGMKDGQSPFGACIVRDGAVICCEHNIVWRDTDATAHAEVTAIRIACKKVGAIRLEGATIYSTTEPCPMCFASIHWARCSRIYYGTNIADVAALGFNEMEISNFQMRDIGKSPVEVFPDFMREECLELLHFWQNLTTRQTY